MVATAVVKQTQWTLDAVDAGFNFFEQRELEH